MSEEKTKVLKIKMGEVYVNEKTYPVYQTAWKKTSKKGETYYQMSIPIFVQEVDLKKKEGGSSDA